ncbi:hypothetical protein C2855_04365 [Aeromonas bestiarum]|nr:hypothetical protein C2855_04365 [Aeromonas bestiarum]
MFQIGWLSRLQAAVIQEIDDLFASDKGTIMVADGLDEIALCQDPLRPVYRHTRVNHQDNGWGTRIRT